MTDNNDSKKKPYWLDKDIVKQAADFGEILSESGLGREEFHNKSACTVLVLLALKYKCDPISLLQAAYHDIEGRLFFTASGVQQILYGFFGSSIEITKKYCGDWSQIKGKVVVERSTTPWITLRNWSDDEESGLSIDVIITVGDNMTYQLKTMLSSIPDNYRMNNSNWAVNPDQQLYYYTLTRLVRMELPFVLDGFNSEDEQNYVPIKTINENVTHDVNKEDDSNSQVECVIESLDLFMANRQQRKYESMPLDEFHQLVLDVCIAHFNSLLDKNDAQGMDRFMRQQISKMPLSELGKAEFQDHYRSAEKKVNSLYAA